MFVWYRCPVILAIIVMAGAGVGYGIWAAVSR